MKNFDIFNFFAQNVDCGYTLEPPLRGGSDEYPQSMFWIENKKFCIPLIPQFYCIKEGFKGLYFSWPCFYAPNFEEVEGAYWFGSVRAVSPSVSQSVSL